MARKPKPTTTPNALLDALKFVSLVCKDKGSVYEAHVRIADNWISAYNGVLSIGCRHDSAINACPQFKLITEALQRCGQSIAITQLDNDRLSIRSDKFRAIVPCISNGVLGVQSPDQRIVDIDDRLKDAMVIAGEIVDENGLQIYNHSILFNGASIISSMGGSFILECWHGLDLPPLLAIPKSLCAVLSKIDKKLKSFGFSQHSITLYFEDDSWLRSQLYSEAWPKVDHILNVQADFQSIPSGFWEALAAVSPFSDGNVYFFADKLLSHDTEATGASFEVPGLPSGPIFPARQLAFLKDWATVWSVTDQRLLVQGATARAVIAGIGKPYTPMTKAVRDAIDDNIPF